MQTIAISKSERPAFYRIVLKKVRCQYGNSVFNLLECYVDKYGKVHPTEWVDNNGELHVVANVQSKAESYITFN